MKFSRKPNQSRRIRGQRRRGAQDRRQRTLAVENCSRAGATDRRVHADRRPEACIEQYTVLTVEPVNTRFDLSIKKTGQFINTSV